jgi:hypothetical protein
VVHSAQTVHLSCVKFKTISKRIEMSFCLIHVTRSTIRSVQNDLWAYGTFGASCAPMLCQDSHYPQIDWNELQLDARHLVVPSGASKWFPILWYVWRKLCTYLVPRPTLSPNGRKQASTWHTIPRSTIRNAQSHFRARGTLNANREPILRLD